MKNQNNENYGQVERNFHHDEATIVDNTRDEAIESLFDNDQYEYKEDDLNDANHDTNDFNRNETITIENIPNEERIINEDDRITNDEPDDLDDDFNQNDIDDLDDDLEEDGDLDNYDDDDEELEEDDEHFHENHPRE